MKYIPNAMKFGTQSRSSSLIINMIFEIMHLDPKLNTWSDLVSKLQWHSEQILHANYELLIGIDDLEPNLQICEIWSQN